MQSAASSTASLRRLREELGLPPSMPAATMAVLSPTPCPSALDKTRIDLKQASASTVKGRVDLSERVRKELGLPDWMPDSAMHMASMEDEAPCPHDLCNLD